MLPLCIKTRTKEVSANKSPIACCMTMNKMLGTRKTAGSRNFGIARARVVLDASDVRSKPSPIAPSWDLGSAASLPTTKSKAPRGKDAILRPNALTAKGV